MGQIRITSAQIRAARSLLDWSARELANHASVSQSTVHRAETSHGIPKIQRVSFIAIKETLERCGIDFLDESGVRLRLSNGEGSELSHALPTNRPLTESVLRISLRRSF